MKKICSRYSYIVLLVFSGLVFCGQTLASDEVESAGSTSTFPALVSVVLNNKDGVLPGEDLRFQVILREEVTFAYRGLLEFFLQPGNQVRLAEYSGDKPLLLADGNVAYTFLYRTQAKDRGDYVQVIENPLYLGKKSIHSRIKSSNIVLYYPGSLHYIRIGKSQPQTPQDKSHQAFNDSFVYSIQFGLSVYSITGTDKNRAANYEVVSEFSPSAVLGVEYYLDASKSYSLAAAADISWVSFRTTEKGSSQTADDSSIQNPDFLPAISGYWYLESVRLGVHLRQRQYLYLEPQADEQLRISALQSTALAIAADYRLGQLQKIIYGVGAQIDFFNAGGHLGLLSPAYQLNIFADFHQDEVAYTSKLQVHTTSSEASAFERRQQVVTGLLGVRF